MIFRETLEECTDRITETEFGSDIQVYVGKHIFNVLLDSYAIYEGGAEEIQLAYPSDDTRLKRIDIRGISIFMDPRITHRMKIIDWDAFVNQGSLPVLQNPECIQEYRFIIGNAVESCGYCGNKQKRMIRGPDEEYFCSVWCLNEGVEEQ